MTTWNLLSARPLITAGLTFQSGRLQVTEPWGHAVYSVPDVEEGWFRLEAAGDGWDRAEVVLELTAKPERLMLMVAPGDRHLVRLAAGDYTLKISPRARPGGCSPKLSARRLGGAELFLDRAKRGFNILRRQGVAAAIRRLLNRSAPSTVIIHPPADLAARGQIDPFAPRDQPASLAARAKALQPFTVLVRIADGEVAERARTLRSLEAQSASVWTLNTQSASDVTLDLQAGDELAPDALLLIVEAFADDAVSVVYGDDVVAGRVRAKPTWDPRYAQECDYLGRLAWRGRVPLEAGTAAVLALAPRPADPRVRHIACALVRIASADVVSRPDRPLSHRSGALPSVSLVVPTRDRADLLETCLTSLLCDTDYQDLEVVVVDNGSVEPSALETMARWASRDRRCRVLRIDEPFNFSRLSNAGVAASRGEVVGLVNDDVRSLQRDWLSILAAETLDPMIGAVGPLLLYPDGTVQQAGVALGLFGSAGHPWRGSRPEDEPRTLCAGVRSALTAACLLVRREDYLAVGGLDQNAYPVTLNDVDFCLKLSERGLVNLYQPAARMEHAESQTRTPDHAPQNRDRRRREETRFLARWGRLIDDDPWYGRGLTRLSEAGFLRG